MKIMKHLWMPLAAILLVAPATSQAQSLLEKIAITVLADRYGIDTSQVSLFQRQTNLSVYDLAPTYQASYYFKRSPSTIRQLRNQGLGWGEIAHRVGMHPGTFNKLRQQGAFDRDQIWTNSYRERFNAPTQQVYEIRRSGGTLEDVLGSILIGRMTSKDPQTIYNQFREQKSWFSVTQANNVRLEQWRRVSSPVVNRYVIPRERTWTVSKVKSNKGVRDHGKGIGKGKSNTGGKGKGNSSKDKGNGKGKGKGG